MTRTSITVLCFIALAGCQEMPVPPPQPIARTPVAEPSALRPAAVVAETVPAAAPGGFDRSLLALFNTAVPPKREDPPALVELGKLLYFDARLSKNHDISCNSCHDVKSYGVDGKQFSPGHKGQLGGRNSPTVYDAANHVAQFWDGRAKDLEEQAQGPVMNPVEMAMPDEGRVVATLASIPEYKRRFEALFGNDEQPITLANAARAIAAYERQLVTHSRFDRFLDGEHTALTEQEQKGLRTFVQTGCGTCHQGRNLGGGMFMKVGLVQEWPAEKPDLGRFDVTKSEADKRVFRVPALRNVAKTAPYFHNGAQTDLESAVKAMATYQLGRELSEQDAKDIVVFLNALTGDLPPAEVITAPKLPPSTKATPKPDPT